MILLVRRGTDAVFPACHGDTISRLQLFAALGLDLSVEQNLSVLNSDFRLKAVKKIMHARVLKRCKSA